MIQKPCQVLKSVSIDEAIRKTTNSNICEITRPIRFYTIEEPFFFLTVKNE